MRLHIPPREPCVYGRRDVVHRRKRILLRDLHSDVHELNKKLAVHLAWSNRKPMRTLDNKSSIQLLQEKLAMA